MEKNATLAYEVKDIIAKHPDHLFMGTWAGWRDPDGLVQSEMFDSSECGVGLITLDDLTADSCGTVACYAGWTAAVAGYSLQPYFHDARKPDERWNISVLAAELLGLSVVDQERLFYCHNSQLSDRIEEIFGPDPRPDRR